QTSIRSRMLVFCRPACTPNTVIGTRTLGGARAVRRAEDGRSVVPQLVDALADVVEGAVAARLVGGAGKDVGVPAPAQLLHRGHVDRAVVQVLLDLGQVDGEKTPVHADGVAGEGNRPGLRDVLLDELQGGGARVCQ